jgi:hypothetical protein
MNLSDHLAASFSIVVSGGSEKLKSYMFDIDSFPIANPIG